MINNWSKIDIDHITEFDELVTVSCEVKFNFLISKDTTECDSFIFSSHDIHTHSSASSNQLSLELWKDLLKTIVKIQDLTLTACKYFIIQILIVE